MNHKRKSRTLPRFRSEHREAHKKFRQAERAAIRGDRARAPYSREDELPAPNRRGKKRGKKRSIEYCPAREGRKRHHYMEGEETERYFVPRVYDWMPSGWRTYTRRYKLCVYCGHSKSAARRRKGL